jgi:hypothetical protein
MTGVCSATGKAGSPDDGFECEIPVPVETMVAALADPVNRSAWGTPFDESRKGEVMCAAVYFDGRTGGQIRFMPWHHRCRAARTAESP